MLILPGCLIVKVVDHKSVSAQANKSKGASGDEKNTPFSIHNYNQHITPSPYVPYPKQNQNRSNKPGGLKDDTAAKKQQDAGKTGEQTGDASSKDESGEASSEKRPLPAPKVYTTVLHPTPRSLQAELTLLATTPHPSANRKSSTAQNSQKTSTSAAGPPPAKRQRMLVEPQELHECEAKLTKAVAPPLFLEPVDSLEAAQKLLQFLDSPLHRAMPPSPKRRKRTVAELAADEALAAEEERFMLIMDERLQPATSSTSGGAKSAVDETGGVVPFEPRFSRFKTIESIRLQHEEKAKREHERKLQQEQAKRQQQQEQERERRRLLEQRQAEEHAKEEARRQQLAAHQASTLAAQQQARFAQANAMSQVSQGHMSSPIIRNQTPHSMSSPIVGHIGAHGSVPMSMSASGQGIGSPQRPPSALQHGHPGMMGHPMAASRSQQAHSRNGTPQMTHGTPAMSHATPVMRNVTPMPRMGHGSPSSTMAQTPVMSQPMMTTANLAHAPQQHMLLQQRQQLLAQQGHNFSPQQISQIANMHAQQNIQNHQQMMQQNQVQQNHQAQQLQNARLQSQQAYQAQLMRSQLVQMQQLAQQQQQQQQQGQQMNQGNVMQMTAQQQMLMAAAQANGGQLPQAVQQQASMTANQRYQQIYQQRLLALRRDFQNRMMAQYGPPSQYPPQVAQQYTVGLEKDARLFVQNLIRQSRERAQQQQMNAMQQQQQQQQMNAMQQQQNMMANGMGK